MYCAHCGTQNAEGASACRSCGAALSHGAPPPAAGAGRLPTAPNQHWAVPDAVSTLLPGATPHRRRQFWLALIFGTALMALWALQAAVFQSPVANISAMVFGAFYVPVLFVFFMASEGLTEEPPAIVLIEAFAGVALVAIFVAGLVNSFLPYDNLLVGFVEEGCKFLGVVWLLRRRKYVSIMDGILFGAAAGMGFAAIENLGYFFNFYQISGLAAVAHLLQAGKLHSFAQVQQAFNSYGLQEFWSVFLMRSVLGPWMHGTWTAILAGTAWRESAAGRIRLDARFFGTYVLVAVMHSTWDILAGTALQWPYAIVLIGLDIYLLRGLILAAHRQERGEPVTAKKAPKAPRQPVHQAAVVHRAARFCAKCGSPVAEGAKFCGSCGAPARRVPATPQAPPGPSVPTSTS